MRRETGSSIRGSGSAIPPGATAQDCTAAGRGRVPREGHVARFVSSLARAVHAFHTYPPGSPARADVIEVAREALHPCFPDGEEAVWIDVSNEGLSVGGELIYTDRGPERALAIALRRAYVSTLEVRAGTSTRDFRQFAALLAFPDQILGRIEELPEILTQRGVTHIIAHVISTHQTIEAGTIPPALVDVVQRRRESREQPIEAAEGGWIRLDPAVPLDRVTLEDLPLLLRDAPALGVALDRMSRAHGSVSPTQALVLHFQEITELYDACDATVSEPLFHRLAEVVNSLPEESKLTLMKDEVLPGLVDGRRSGQILRHLSEEEVADALCLLLDLGVGGVEMLTAGLANLDLPEERLEGVVGRVSRRLEGDDAAAAELSDWVGENAPRPHDSSLDDRLTVEDGHEADFLALRSFDLSVDETAAGELKDVVRGVKETDPVGATLLCCADILSLSADPAVIAATMRRSRGLFFSLETRGDVASLAEWLALYARVARRRDDHDGEVAEVIRGALDQYVTAEFIHRVSALPPQADRESPLVTIICELGRTGVGALIDSLAVESDLAARNRLLTALQPRAPALAEHLVDYLSHPKWFVVRNLLRLLGHAGPGWEQPVAELIDHDHPRVIREAFIALARIGTPEAADRTVQALRHESAEVRHHAAEAIWRFAPALSHPRLLAAVDDRELATEHPELVLVLVHAAGRRRLEGLEPVLRRLRWHGLAVWNAERRTLGWQAFRLLGATP